MLKKRKKQWKKNENKKITKIKFQNLRTKIKVK